MGYKGFMDENKGQALSLDLMLGFIIMTVIVGISADAMDIASYKMQDYSSEAFLERITTDAADILVKSSGSPDDWELYGMNQDIIPGLAKKDPDTDKSISNTLSIQKIDKLKENYDTLIYDKILPRGFNSRMILYPSNDSLAPITIMDNGPPPNTCDVAVANRTVLLDFMHLKAVINSYEGNASGEECPNPDHNLNNSNGKLEWTCKYFNISREELETSDFYIITRGDVSSSAGWVIDKANRLNDTVNPFTSQPALINDKIADIMGSSSDAILWLHIITAGKPGYDCYIVSVPKGTDHNMVNLNYLDTGPWFFVLQVWD